MVPARVHLVTGPDQHSRTVGRRPRCTIRVGVPAKGQACPGRRLPAQPRRVREAAPGRPARGLGIWGHSQDDSVWTRCPRTLGRSPFARFQGTPRNALSFRPPSRTRSSSTLPRAQLPVPKEEQPPPSRRAGGGGAAARPRGGRRLQTPPRSQSLPPQSCVSLGCIPFFFNPQPRTFSH